MTKPFKKLFGNRVFLEIPKVPESSVILSEESKKKWIEDQKLTLNKFKVYAVGDIVESIKEGDEVAVDFDALERSKVLTLTKDVQVIPVAIFNISLLW